MKGIEIIRAQMACRRAGHPAILMGDFNVGEDNPVIALLKGVDASEGCMVDTFSACHPNEEPDGTCHAFSGRADCKRIDYIFATSDVRTIDAAIDRTTREGRCLSDHFPVAATLRFGHTRSILSQSPEESTTRNARNTEQDFCYGCDESLQIARKRA
jgi:endonuclease/exonuclease/phosphatase family metal-dependent hydrolase